MLKVWDGKNKSVSLSIICVTLTLMAGAVFSFHFFFAVVKVIFDNQLEFFRKNVSIIFAILLCFTFVNGAKEVFENWDSFSCVDQRAP